MEKKNVIERKTFYGTTSCNTCAYCYKHFLSLTPKQVEKRGCLRKQCNALRRFEDHPFFQRKAKTKEKRYLRKAEMERRYLEATHQVA